MIFLFGLFLWILLVPVCKEANLEVDTDEKHVVVVFFQAQLCSFNLKIVVQRKSVLQLAIRASFSYNRRPNELRHLAQNWAFLHFINFKRRKYSFLPHPLLAMLCPCSSCLQKTTNTPTLNGGDRGWVRIPLFSETTLFKYNVSTILSPIV